MDIDAIRTFIQRELLGDEAQPIERDQDLLLTGMLDSLGVIRLVEHMQRQTGIKIPAEDVTLENFGSLARIEAYLSSRADPS